MPDLNFRAPAPERDTSTTARTGLHGGALMTANAQAQTRLGQPPASGQDVQGHALRQLRLAQGVDPAELATRACLSLRQLYQLESGEHTLFYSTSLRNQAGRRVAALLGADWAQLAQAQDQAGTAD